MKPLVFFTLLLLCFVCPVFSEIPLQPVKFHDSLGTEIDSVENNTWKIIGQVPGFKLAKVYEHDILEYYLHIVGQEEDRPLFIICRISPETFNAIKKKLSARIPDKSRNENLPFVYEIQNKYINSTNQYRLFLEDKSIINGELVGIQSDTLIIQSFSNINVMVPDDKVIRIEKTEPEAPVNRYYLTDPCNSRLLFLPTGFGLKRGRGNVSIYEFMFATAGYGITDNISLYGGRTILAHIEEGVSHLMPKVSCPIGPSFNAALGLMRFKTKNDADAKDMAFGVLTAGSQETNFTLGMGLRVDRNPGGDQVYMVGGGMQLGNHVKLVGEYWTFKDEKRNTAFVYGFRLFGENLAVDIGILSVCDEFIEPDFISVIWLGFNIFWGKH